MFAFEIPSALSKSWQRDVVKHAVIQDKENAV